MDSQAPAAVVVLADAGAAEGRARAGCPGERLEDPLKDQLDFGNWRHARGDLFFFFFALLFHCWGALTGFVPWPGLGAAILGGPLGFAIFLVPCSPDCFFHGLSPSIWM